MLALDRNKKPAIVLCALALALCACRGAQPIDPTVPSVPQNAIAANVTPAAGKIVLTPSSLSFTAAGSAYAQKITASEPNYSGAFTQVNTCAKKATLTPSSGKGPKLAFTVTPVAAGSCTLTIKDAGKNAASAPVGVTTSGVVISGKRAQ